MATLHPNSRPSQRQISELPGATRAVARASIRTDPINKEQVERGHAALYSMAGYRKPAFLWCSSPLQCVAAASLLWLLLANRCRPSWTNLMEANGGEQWWMDLGERMEDQLLPETEERLQEIFAKIFRSPTRDYSLWGQINFDSILTEELPRTLMNTLPSGLARSTTVPRRLDSLRLALVAELLEHTEGRRGDRILAIARRLIAPDATERLRRFDEQAPLVIRQQVFRMQWGLWQIPELAGFFAVEDVIGVAAFTEEALHAMELLRAIYFESFASIMLPELCILCERPTKIEVDEELRLHCEDGEALLFADNSNFYSWRGAAVPAFAIHAPHTLSFATIMEQRNVASRRAMIDIAGPERFLVSAKAAPICVDECGTLYRVELSQDEALVMVKVRNSTPEPDGTYKDYYLRVPPTIVTARQAVAWTFGLTSEAYVPDVQT